MIASLISLFLPCIMADISPHEHLIRLKVASLILNPCHAKNERATFIFAPLSPTIIQSFTSQYGLVLSSNLQTLCNNTTGFTQETDYGVESAQVFCVRRLLCVRGHKFSLLPSTFVKVITRIRLPLKDQLH